MCEIAVCDDSALDREHLVERIKRLAVHQKLRIHEYSSGTELLDAMNHIRFTAIFLDIQMEGMSGDDTAKQIRERDSTLVLAFYTGYAEPTPERFEVMPFRYLMKNMPDAQLDEYVKATLNKAEECSSMPVLAANLHKKAIFIDSKYIIYIEKYKKTTRAELTPEAYERYGIKAGEDGRYPDIRIAGTLEKIYAKLKRHGFGWPHNSYIINFKYMKTCTCKSVRLENVAVELPIARSKTKEFNELKGRFICAKYVEKE